MSKKTTWILGVSFLILTVGLLTYGLIADHEEGGLLRDDISWQCSDFPLTVSASAYKGSQSEANRVVKDAVDESNEDLGFKAFRFTKDQETKVKVLLGVPQIVDGSTHVSGEGIKDSGGEALLTDDGKHWKSCEAFTSNVIGVTMTHRTLRHELGHCLGLDHDDFKSSIMRDPPASGWGWPPGFTDHDKDLIKKQCE